MKYSFEYLTVWLTIESLTGVFYFKTGRQRCLHFGLPATTCSFLFVVFVFCRRVYLSCFSQAETYSIILCLATSVLALSWGRGWYRVECWDDAMQLKCHIFCLSSASPITDCTLFVFSLHPVTHWKSWKNWTWKMFQTKILCLPSITEIIQQDATYMFCAVSQTNNM